MRAGFIIILFLLIAGMSFGQEEKEYRLDDFFQIFITQPMNF